MTGEPLDGFQEEHVREIAEQEIRRFVTLLAAELDAAGLAVQRLAAQNALVRFDAGEQT